MTVGNHKKLGLRWVTSKHSISSTLLVYDVDHIHLLSVAPAKPNLKANFLPSIINILVTISVTWDNVAHKTVACATPCQEVNQIANAARIDFIIFLHI